MWIRSSHALPQSHLDIPSRERGGTGSEVHTLVSQRCIKNWVLKRGGHKAVLSSLKKQQSVQLQLMTPIPATLLLGAIICSTVFVASLVL